MLHLLAGAWLAASPAVAAGGGVGENAAEFLLIRPGARALGLAEAFGPIAEGPDALYWNPAGLATLVRPEFSYSRTQYLRLLSHDYYAIGLPTRWAGGNLGFAATIVQEDTLPVVDRTGTTTGSFRPHDEVVALGWARAIDAGGELSNLRDDVTTWDMPGTVLPRQTFYDPWKAGVAFGITGKAIYHRYFTNRATAFAADVGLLWRPFAARGLSLSAVGRNLGSKTTFANQENALPAELSLGAAYDARHDEHHRFLPTFELHLPWYGRPSGGLGFEYSRHAREPGVRLAWRAGYSTHGAYDQSVLAGINAGLGVGVGPITVDFGFAPFDALGDIYRMSFAWRF